MALQKANSMMGLVISNDIFLFALFAFSVLCRSSSSAIISACISQPLVLKCKVQDPLITWKYKEFGDKDDFQKVAVSTKNETYFSVNKPKKFDANITMIFPNNSMVISSVLKNHSGIYACQSQSGTDLHIVAAVECEKRVHESDNVTIHCALLEYKDDIGLHSYGELVWKKGNKKLFSIGKDKKVMDKYHEYPNIEVTQEALRIGSVSKELNGERFTCVVHGQNGETPRESHVVLKVQERQGPMEKEVGGTEPTGYEGAIPEGQLGTQQNPNPEIEQHEEADHDQYIFGALFFLLALSMVFILPLIFVIIYDYFARRRKNNQQCEV